MRKPFLLAGVFIVLYLVAAVLLLGPFGGAGHGWGVGAFLDLSLPASLIAIAIDEAFPHHSLAVWLSVLFGSLQYGLLGFLLQRVGSYVIRRLT